MINPVRYPGGKGKKKIVERVLSLYPEHYFRGKTWVEPFAGGCGLGLSLLERGEVEQCIFNDHDPRIRDMWKVIGYHSDRLIMAIDRLDVTIERFFEAREKANDPASTTWERGFNTYILNRCARSGYIDGGAIGGNAQDGEYKIDCRFNKDTLCKHIEIIGDLVEKGKIAFTSGYEACNMLENMLSIPSDAFIYLDPPYSKKGKACYKTRIDHDRLHDVLMTVSNEWLLSYDADDTILKMYAGRRIEDLEVTYSNNTSTRGKNTEKLILSEYE